MREKIKTTNELEICLDDVKNKYEYCDFVVFKIFYRNITFYLNEWKFIFEYKKLK